MKLLMLLLLFSSSYLQGANTIRTLAFYNGENTNDTLKNYTHYHPINGTVVRYSDRRSGPVGQNIYIANNAKEKRKKRPDWEYPVMVTAVIIGLILMILCFSRCRGN
jgi:hypothetical protein